MAELFFFLAGIVWWIAAAGYGAEVASQKGYNGSLWFLGGFFFSPIVLIAAAGLPDRKDRNHEQPSA